MSRGDENEGPQSLREALLSWDITGKSHHVALCHRFDRRRFVNDLGSFSGERSLDQAQRRTAVMAEELGLLIDGATNYAIYMLDTDGCVTVWNRGAERIKGWTEAQIIGRNSSVFYTPEDLAAGKPRKDLHRANLEGRVEEDSWRVRKDGSEFLASVTITALRDDAGVLRGFGKVVRDITDQKATELGLARREEHLRSILATVPDAMIVMDERGIISSFSAAAEQLFVYVEADVVGLDVEVLIPGDEVRGGSFPSRYCRPTEIRRGVGLKKDGTHFPVELAVGEASVSGDRIFTCFIRDLTRRQETEKHVEDLQAELVRVSRISAMGTMASTLAHEINQPLTSVANYLETVLDMLDGTDAPPIDEIQEALKLAAAQSLRAGEIIRRLRSFVETGDTGIGVESLEAVVEEATSLGLLGAHEAGIEVSMTIAAGCDWVMVDRVQIQQVLVNLIRNAIQAMVASPLKRLTIATAPDRGGWVKVTVSDTGEGIDSSIQDHLFEAFATTKEDGMGLGLSICRTIIEAHGGRIWVDSEPGEGAAFHFCVPLAEGSDG